MELPELPPLFDLLPELPLFEVVDEGEHDEEEEAPVGLLEDALLLVAQDALLLVLDFAEDTADEAAEAELELEQPLLFELELELELAEDAAIGNPCRVT